MVIPVSLKRELKDRLVPRMPIGPCWLVIERPPPGLASAAPGLNGSPSPLGPTHSRSRASCRLCSLTGQDDPGILVPSCRSFPQRFVSFSWWIHRRTLCGFSLVPLNASLLGITGISSRLRFHVGDDSVAKAGSLSGPKQPVAPRSPNLASRLLDSIGVTHYFVRVPSRP